MSRIITALSRVHRHRQPVELGHFQLAILRVLLVAGGFVDSAKSRRSSSWKAEEENSVSPQEDGFDVELLVGRPEEDVPRVAVEPVGDVGVLWHVAHRRQRVVKLRVLLIVVGALSQRLHQRVLDVGQTNLLVHPER
jgi:hypothetical protein